MAYDPSSRDGRGTPRRLLYTIVLLWLGAAAVYGVLRLTYGGRPAYVHVRWAPTLDEGARAERERAYTLTQGGRREGQTWGYVLADVSRDNIRRLIQDPVIEDTHNLHRTAFRVGFRVAREPYAGPGPSWIGSALEGLVFVLLALAAAVSSGALVNRFGPSGLRRWTAPVVRAAEAPGPTLRVLFGSASRWLESRIPAASAEALAIYRILFGLASLGYLVTHRVTSDWLATANAESSLHQAALDAFALAPAVVDWIQPWLVFWGLLFVIGAAARLSFVMFTAGILAWGMVYTVRIGSHSVEVPLVVMLLVLFSRWGDAWSVDAWWRAQTAAGEGDMARPVQSRTYGYTMWIPGLVLGASLGAAAFSKLSQSGIAWITNGSVKYHFLADAHQAPVDWGGRLAQNNLTAVLMSFGGVAAEAFIIIGVLSTIYWWRLAAGVATVLLVTGFWLFQGLFWPFWAVMLLSFLPWHVIRPAAPVPARVAGARRPLVLRAQIACVVLLLCQQVIASIYRIEYAPLVSAWDMYSTTYASVEEFEQKAGMTYRMVGTFKDGTSGSCRMDPDAALAYAADWKDGRQPSFAGAFVGCFSTTPTQVVIEGVRRKVDWAQWQFGDEVRIPLAGPFDVR